MSTTTMKFTGELTVTSCWCGIRVAIPDSLYREARENGHAVYCPIGHTFVWTETEQDRLRDQLAAEKRRREWAESSRSALRDQLEATERSRAALKGHLTRARNRIAAGVCPVQGCRRHFENVQAHIASEHPSWHVTDPETGKAAVL